MRELRLIAAHSPRYNRRSRFPERMPWVRLTSEPYPRLSVVREVKDDDGATYIGPFASAHDRPARRRRAARDVPDPAVHPAAAARRAGGRVGVRAGRDGPVRRAVHRRTRARRLRRRRRRASGTRCSPTPTPVVGAHADRIDVARRPGAVRGGRDGPGPARRASCAARRARSGSRRWRACAELVAARSDRRRRVGARAGAATAGSPAPRASTAAPTPGRRSRRCRRPGEHVEAPVAPAPGGAPRGDRPRSRLARAARRAARRGREHLGLPGALRAAPAATRPRPSRPVAAHRLAGAARRCHPPRRAASGRRGPDR